jgi:hypothetical protein
MNRDLFGKLIFAALDIVIAAAILWVLQNRNSVRLSSIAAGSNE